MSDNISIPRCDIVIEKTTRGKDMLILNGYHFYVNSKNNDKFYWQCIEKQSKQCRSTVITKFTAGDGHSIIKPASDHSHSPSASKSNEITLKNCLKRDACSFSAPTQIIQNNLAAIPSSSACSVPNKNALRQIIRRARKKQIPVEPKTLHEIDVPEEMKVVEGELFLARDVTYGQNKRMLIFCTRKNIEILQNTSSWQMDGTFQSCPKIFKQIYSIHGFIGNDIGSKKIVPLVYCLLPDKTEESYMTFFKELKSYALELEYILNPAHIVTDFEIAVLNVVKIEFPDAIHNACLFHFGQSIWRKIQSCHLATRYGNDSDFSLKLRHIISLAYLPPEEILEAFTLLKDNVFPEEAEEVIEYFEKYYVCGKIHSNVTDTGITLTRTSPMFPPSIWSIHRSNTLHLPRTQNSIEAWHRRWNGLLNQTRFGVYTTIQYMQKEQMTTNHAIEKCNASIEKTPPRKKRVQRFNAIERICQNKAKMNTLDFLRAIANYVEL